MIYNITATTIKSQYKTDWSLPEEPTQDDLCQYARIIRRYETTEGVEVRFDSPETRSLYRARLQMNEQMERKRAEELKRQAGYPNSRTVRQSQDNQES